MVKKEGGSFNVTTGEYDGAEVPELVGIYKLYLIRKKCDSKNIGLYRDDGLAVIKNVKLTGFKKQKNKNNTNIYNVCLSKKACK